MSDGTKIEWTDATWNPITGCSVVSPGCTHCYAMRLAGTRLQHHPSRAGLTNASKAGPVWNGKVRLNEQWLDQPIRWKKPRRIFVCAHGDLFHENVPYRLIDRVFAVMALCPHHNFQVLTKRASGMRDYIRNESTAPTIYDEVCDMAINDDTGGAVLVAPGIDPNAAPPGRRVNLGVWPLPNVWLGVSVEDQARANERIPDLLATPAAVRFVSAEPLLLPVSLQLIRYEGMTNINSLTGDHGVVLPLAGRGPHLDWVIVGGESGPEARPMDPEWARSIRDQCADAGVAFFMKQMARKAAIPDDLMIREFPT